MICLKAAGNAVKRASDNLVRAAQKAAFDKSEDDSVVVKTKFVGGIAQVRQNPEKCLKKERKKSLLLCGLPFSLNVCTTRWYAKMPQSFFFFWNCDELLWINSPSASFQSCLPGLPDTLGCKTSHLLKTWELASLSSFEKKKDSNWRVSVSLSKLQGATGSFTFHLDWWQFLSQPMVHPSCASACQLFYLTSEAHCLIDVWSLSHCGELWMTLFL